MTETRDIAIKRRAAVAKAQLKQQEAGWARLHLRLGPAAAKKLDRLCQNSGKTPVAVISRLLLNARS